MTQKSIAKSNISEHLNITLQVTEKNYVIVYS